MHTRLCLCWLAWSFLIFDFPDSHGSAIIAETEVEELFMDRTPTRFILKRLDGTQDWHDALRACQEVTDQSLATILSASENLAIVRMLEDPANKLEGTIANGSDLDAGQNYREAWIAMRLNRTNTNFEWHTGCASVYTNWCPQMSMLWPASGGLGGCVSITEDGHWEMNWCQHKIKYAICEERAQQCTRYPADAEGYCQPGFDYKCGSKCYHWGGLAKFGRQSMARTSAEKPDNAPLNFQNATAYCASLNGTLVVIQNWAENHCLRGRVNGYLNFDPQFPPWEFGNGGFWIASLVNVTRSYEWNYWYNFEDFSSSWTNWYPAKNVNATDNLTSSTTQDSCGLMGWMGLWHNASCGERQAYICQTDMMVDAIPPKKTYKMVAFTIVSGAGICVIAFIFIVLHVCCRTHPSPAASGSRVIRPPGKFS